MQTLAFSPCVVAGIVTVSGLVTVSIILYIGTLADRFGNGPFLLASCVITGLAALVLNAAESLWQFWLAATMLMIARGVNL
jgi:hypothetical protein